MLPLAEGAALPPPPTAVLRNFHPRHQEHEAQDGRQARHHPRLQHTLQRSGRYNLHTPRITRPLEHHYLASWYKNPLLSGDRRLDGGDGFVLVSQIHNLNDNLIMLKRS